MVQKLDLGGSVVFTGLVPHSEVPHYAAAADLLVLTSLVETQGLVLIEGMAAGTPAVAVEAPGPADVLAEGGGLLTLPREDAFATAVLGLLADGQRRRALGAQAARAVRRYSMPATTATLVSVYEEAVAAGPRPTRKALDLLLERRPTAESWRKVSDQIRSLGESLAAAFSTAREGEEARRHLEDVRSGLKALIDQVDQATQPRTKSDS
jgi:hypothetical protein